MKIADYIKEYLSNHPYLVLPKTGVFMIQHVAAVHQSKEGIIKAPSSKLLFNAAKQVEDAGLYLFIQEAKNCSFDAAKKWVDQALIDLHQKLNSSEVVVWDALGVWNKVGDKITFSAYDHVALGPHYYGLNDVFVSAKEQLHEASIHALEMPESSEKPSKKFNLSVPSAAAVMIGAIGLGYFLAQSPQLNNEVYQSLNVIDTSAFVQKQKSSTAYYIIYKSFSEQENAAECVANLAAQNITAQILPEKGLYKVYLSEHHDLYDAKDTLQIWQNLNAKVWIYKSK